LCFGSFVDFISIEKKGGGIVPQFDTSTYIGQIFWLVISFGLLWGAIHFWIYPMFGRILEKREQHVQGLILGAQNLKNDIANLHSQIKEELQKAQEAGQKLIVNAQSQKQDQLKALQERLTLQHRDAIEKFRQELEQQSRGINAQDQEKFIQEIASLLWKRYTDCAYLDLVEKEDFI
jgi:F-type H+-transporting ATPase subunit b